ncbi:MAG TPA: phosphoribosylglycinamide formyltransferase [Burkholderiales bacterium]|nr:phosphoribosylglycinamide formyltransferase [Burkholderiales bacterium]
MKRLVILISGRGSNMGAILASGLPAEVRAVISNTPAAAGLHIAGAAGVATQVVDQSKFASRVEFDRALGDAVDACRPDLVVLAGFMRILGAEFIARFQGRIMNIHPSLLPAFPGLGTHRQAIRRGVKLHGCSVHFVTPELDAGPIVIQAAVPVLPDDDEATLAARVLEQEHVIYPQAIRWFLEGRISLEDGRVRISGALRHPGAVLSPMAA